MRESAPSALRTAPHTLSQCALQPPPTTPHKLFRLVERGSTHPPPPPPRYVEHPAHTRYTLKYRHTDGKVVLKVTNDRQCLKYLTDQAGDVKRIEKLNNLFVTYMCGQDPHEADVEMAESSGNAKPTSVEDSSSSKKHRGKR